MRVCFWAGQHQELILLVAVEPRTPPAPVACTSLLFAKAAHRRKQCEGLLHAQCWPLCMTMSSVCPLPGKLNVMGREQDGGSPAVELVEKIQQFLLMPGIDAGSRLIDDQYLRVHDQGSGNRHAFFFAMTEKVRRFIPQMFNVNGLQCSLDPPLHLVAAAAPDSMLQMICPGIPARKKAGCQAPGKQSEQCCAVPEGSGGHT